MQERVTIGIDVRVVGRGLSLRSFLLELVQRYVVDPHRASRLDDEPCHSTPASSTLT